MTIRVGVIGAGIMGSDHARVIAEDLPGATLQVICDVAKNSAKRVADATGAVDIATDSLETVRRSDVDAVLVASPDATHAPLTKECISLHKPVLCEKPLAENAAECLEIVKAEAAAGQRLVQVGFMRRFDPEYVQMRATLRAGTIGQAIMMHNFHRNVEAPSWFTGAMAITNSAPHEFDILRFVLDAEVTAISAFEPANSALGACKPVIMVLRTDLGQLVTVEVNNNAAYGYDVRAELVGVSGSASLARVTSGAIDVNMSASTAYAEDWRPRFAEACRLQNKAWIKSIQTGTPCPDASSAWDGYCATAIAEAGARALASGRETAVSLADRPALYDTLGAAA